MEDNSYIASFYNYGLTNGLEVGFGVGPNTPVDEVLIKVNSQKNFDWMTSLDFDSQGDSYIKAMVDNEFLYVSVGSGNSNMNYWLGELLLSTGEVIRSKWFLAYSEVLVKPWFFDLILLSETHMVTIQYYDKVLKYFTSILIFDKNTFTPLKKIDFHWWEDL